MSVLKLDGNEMQKNEMKMKELELYVHIPFCVRKCSYCDFLSAPAPQHIRSDYLARLLLEMQAAGLAYRDYCVSSVFVGGGTPSILSASQMLQLFSQLHDSFCMRPDAEITVECNPGTLNREKLQAYRKAGVNRLSIGLQSADDKELRLLGRIHTFEQFVQNFYLARELGFDNINADIISAIPGQKINVYEQTLEKVTELGPEHISAYSLMIEEGTPFYDQYAKAEQLRQRGNMQHQLPSEEEERQMYELTKSLLRQKGYERYEISNYALTGFECRHNIGYWTGKNYLGIGLGASSCIEHTRFSNISDLNRYLELDFADLSKVTATRERLSKAAQMEEFMFLGLRMMRGVSADDFRRRFSCSIESIYGKVLQKQLKQKLISETADGYCLTDYGVDVSNYVFTDYLLN